MKANRIRVRIHLKNGGLVKKIVKSDQGTFRLGELEYLVRQDRIYRDGRKLVLDYPEGDAEPVDYFGGTAHVTPMELNQHMRNRYVEQVMSLLGGSLQKSLPFIIMIGLAVACIISLWYGQKNADHIDALQSQIQVLLPHPTPTPGPGVR